MNSMFSLRLFWPLFVFPLGIILSFSSSDSQWMQKRKVFIIFIKTGVTRKIHRQQVIKKSFQKRSGYVYGTGSLVLTCDSSQRCIYNSKSITIPFITMVQFCKINALNTQTWLSLEFLFLFYFYCFQKEKSGKAKEHQRWDRYLLVMLSKKKKPLECSEDAFNKP